MAAPVRHGVRLIPFGGGSNIAGCIEPTGHDGRMIGLGGMRRMDRLLQLEHDSETALFEPGVLGPALEEQLNRRRLHARPLPRFFLFSTLGGWVATRSAGMQSDRYGKIEDMVLALKHGDSQRDDRDAAVPKASNGIDINHLCIGSEETLGIITRGAAQRTPSARAQGEPTATFFPISPAAWRRSTDASAKSACPPLRA